MAQYQYKQELIHFSPCLCFSKMQASPGHIKGAGFILSQLREEITRNKVHQVKPNDKEPSNTMLLDLIYCCNDLLNCTFSLHPFACLMMQKITLHYFLLGKKKSVLLRISFIRRFLFKISADGLFSFY